MSRKRWSKEDEDLLKEIYPIMSKDEILSKFPERNWQAIQIRANRLNVTRLNYFSQEEIDFIFENYDKLTYEEIAKEINRSLGTVSNKIRELGLIRQEFWNKEDEDILIKSFNQYSVEYISENILKNRTKSSIYHRCQILKLSKETKRYTKDELLSLLKELADKLERTPMVRELSKYGLPDGGTYLRNFGSFTNVCEILELDLTCTIYNQTKTYLSKRNDICRSKSEQIITNFLIDNNIEYLMDKRYSTICKLGDFGRKRYDWLIDNIVVEYFGLNRKKDYQKRMKDKIELCAINNLELIQVFDKDILKLETVFARFL